MKVLFNTYPMAFHTPGGGEVQLLQYSKFLRETEVEVKLLDQWNPQFLNSDLVHFFSSMGGSLHFCAFIKKIGMPLVVSPNLWITEETKHLYPYKEIRTQFVLADRVIGNSDIECDKLAWVFNIPRDKFVTVYNGVDETFFEPACPDFFRKHYGIDGPFILNVANVESRKNQLQLIKALKKFPDLKLIIIGHERDTDYLQLCITEGGNQLQYLGPLPHDSLMLRSAYSACELFALPSTLETPGLAALEAAACGAKVLVTSEGSAKEYFGEGVTYVDPNDVGDIARGIAIALLQNNTFLLALSVRTNFTWRQATKVLSKLYDEIVNSESFKISASGFYPIDTDGIRLFAWSMPYASFTCGIGMLSFIWHSVSGARVDIYIDGEPAQLDVEVGTNWSPFTIAVLAAPGRITREVSLRVKGAAKPSSGDPRIFGVALADVTFTASLLDERIFSSETSSGFYPIETDGIRLFAWSMPYASFTCGIGTLSFIWHSVNGAHVDIYIDGKPAQLDVEVGANWSPFIFEVFPAPGLLTREVFLRVKGASSGDPRKLGVALADMVFTACGHNDETPPILYEEIFTSKTSSGFYPIESNGIRFYAWSMLHSNFYCGIGTLSFIWHSVNGAHVDIYIDGEPAQLDVEVGTNWSPFTIAVLAAPGRITREVSLRVKGAAKPSSGDPRILGVALADVTLVRKTMVKNMRIVIDLQACQCASRFRGIGRYSMSLAQAMTRQAVNRGHDVRVVLSEKFPETIPAMLQAFDGLIPPECISVFSVPGAVAEMLPANASRARAAEQVREQYLASLSPDVVHVASLFEGWLDDAVTSIHASEEKIQTAVTLYDLIPLVLSDIYLVDPGYREYYFRKLESLKQSDIFLAISEYTRREAIERLGFEPSRIINISAAVDETFQPRSYSAEARQRLFDKYKITKPFVLYVPGGFDPRKNFDRLIEAFAQIPGNLCQYYQLVIASKMPDGVRENFADKAARLGMKAGELLLTGYMPDDDLIAMYCLCKLFVFPSLHEGFGLPALEAMACGAPVVGSNTTSLPEVIGREDALFDPTSVGSIATMLHKGLTDVDFERSLREHAPVQAKKFSWDNSAKLAIDAFEWRHMQNLLNYSISMNQSRTIDKQLLVDISELVNRDAKSGVQRVVRSILLELLKHPPAGYRIEPVYFETGNGLCYAHRFKARLMDKGALVGGDAPINFAKGDIFVGLDLTAHLFPALTPILKQMRESGVRIHYVIYDLTPLLHPQWHGPEMTAAFIAWIDSLGQLADNLVCISAAVADDVKQWLMQHPVKRPEQVQVSHIHLGADINNSLPTTGLPEDADQVLAKLADNPSFLMVGTIEPRKGYSQALAAFEELWAAGNAVNLVIVGKGGWNVDALLAQLSSHPELNKRLFWLDGISDEYLEKIYQASTALLAASEAEGFGLPLIEAAQHKLPIIARRIPVFCEVAGKHAFYFDGTDPSELAQSIRTWIDLFSQGNAPKVEGMPWLTWAESAKQLLAACRI